MKIRRLENFLRYSEEKLYNKLEKELKKLGYSPVRDTADQYLYAEGDMPVLLIAHTDTAHFKEPNKVYFDPRHGVMWSPDGLGADDRAGVFAVMEIVKHFKCGVLFCSGEESGGIGAKCFIQDYPDNPKYTIGIELDRCNDNDCVFYDNEAFNFHKYIEGFGFKKTWGSFSDISIIGPVWKLNCVNLSIGYKDEHMNSEHLFLGSMFATVEKVKNILTYPVPEFEYKERKLYYSKQKTTSRRYHYDDWDEFGRYSPASKTIDWCDLCQKGVSTSLMEEVEYGTYLICKACLQSKCFTCESCGEYMLRYYHKIDGMCDDCWDMLMKYDPESLKSFGEDEKKDLTIIEGGGSIEKGENRSDGDAGDGNNNSEEGGNTHS